MKVKYLSTKETCQELKVTKMTISRMVKNGKLKPINHHKEFYLFKCEDVMFLKDFRANN